MRAIDLVSPLLALLVACGGPNTTGPTGRGTFAQCFGDGGDDCTGTAAYESCIEASCDDKLQTAFGVGYKGADYTGTVCTTYVQCEIKCVCGDTGCQTSCEANLNDACDAAIAAVGECERATTCQVPVCMAPGDVDAGVAVTPDAN